MNAIIGFTELLQDKLSEPKLLSYVNTIHSASNDLLLLINDILDLSKIEAGKMEISKTAINPHTLFNELAHIFRLTVEKKGLDMMLDVDPLIPEGLMLDMIRLRQVLVNLLGNAIKFTEQGYVKLSASIENQDELTSRLDLRIDVEDTGMGIAQGHLETIFKDFEQTDELDRSKYAGTGLGLSISLRLTELMGGTLSVKSVLGKGSTFTVHLKQVDVTAVIQSDSKHALSDDIIFEPSTILVVDDVEYNRELVAENFVDTQVKVIQAGNGQEAIEMVDRYHPNLILMDLRMPVMDGYQAAKQIKSDSDIPVVALTASVMKDEFDNVKSTYFDGYIRKPVKQEALLACLSAYLPYTVAEKEAELEEQRLNEEEKAQLPYLFDELEAKMETWRVIEQSNNMKAIQQFATALSRLAEKTQVRLLEEYAQALLHSVDVFDIDEMDHLLKRYPRLSEELLALSR
jgi:two-component system sensor histidine kinase EvgS